MTDKNEKQKNKVSFVRHSLTYGLKRKFLLLFLIVLVGFIILGINFKDKKKYENVAIAQTKTENFEQSNDMENKSNMTKKGNNSIKKISVNNMKISTPDQCKEKGLHYIGKMTVPRVFHKTIKMQNGNILILKGYSKIQDKKIIDYGNYNEPIEYISEDSAEIYNPTNNSFLQLKSQPAKEDILKLLKIDNNILIIFDRYYQIFDAINNVFQLPNEKKIYKRFGRIGENQYSEIINNNTLIECSGFISNEYRNCCWLTDIDNFEIKSTQNINMQIPKYLTPNYFGYLKLNKNEILIYTKSFPRTDAKNIYISIYNLKNKIITKSIEIKDVGNYKIAKPILLENNKILFTGGVNYEGGAYIHYDKIYPWFIYDVDLNKIEKTIKMIFPNSITSQEPINLENENLLIVENNKIRQLYNVKTNNLEKYDGFELENIVNPNIIQINNHQLLITGGRYTKKELNKFISNDAYIYTF